jgi:hypothetical protein
VSHPCVSFAWIVSVAFLIEPVRLPAQRDLVLVIEGRFGQFVWPAKMIQNVSLRASANGPVVCSDAKRRPTASLVLPDRIELRLQSSLILILFHFSVRRSVFVWHSWVALLVLESTLQGP